MTPNAGFTQPGTFSCGKLPVDAACSFNPATVTPAEGSITTTVTISTNGGPVALLLPGVSLTMLAYALTHVGLMLIGGLWYRRRADTQTHRTAVLLISVIAMASCSSSDSAMSDSGSDGTPPATGTPARNSTVTVTTPSGGSSTDTLIHLTVTRSNWPGKEQRDSENGGVWFRT